MDQAGASHIGGDFLRRVENRPHAIRQAATIQGTCLTAPARVWILYLFTAIVAMSDQLPLPFVSIVGASSSVPPESYPEVRRPKRNPARSRQLMVAGRAAEAPPASASDEETSRLDVHDYLVRNDESSFCFQVRDDAMVGAGIFDGDMLVVDKRIQPAHGHIVLALVNGERLVRRLHHRGRKTALLAESPDVPELLLEDGTELTIWGVVVGGFKRLLG